MPVGGQSEEHIWINMPPEGVLIENAREALGLSQNEVARRAGYTKGTRYRDVVYGVRSDGRINQATQPATWAKLAAAVGLTADAFLAMEPPRVDIASLIGGFTLRVQSPTIPDLDLPPDAATALITLQGFLDKDTFNQVVWLITRRLKARRRRGSTTVD
jgi:hypothetical protein